MSANAQGLNEQNWQRLFQKHNILEEIAKNNFYVIDSTEINVFRESRLMTKFDHRSNLPPLFSKHNLSILPISRGSYIISDFEAYRPLTYGTSIKLREIDFPKGIESIDRTSIYSEAAALNCAYAAGIIDELLGEKTIPTVSGRMSTSAFEFNIKTVRNVEARVQVNNSQCEIDGGYEGPTKLALVEAKNIAADDFLIRQLYYPYRLWSAKVSKEVVPVFMTYSNDTFSFFVYKFTDLQDYNSLQLVEQRNYTFASEPITVDNLHNILKNVRSVPEPELPFPQADKFGRVVDLLGLLMVKDMAADEITANYDFDARQTNYYTSAGMYLGLVDRKRIDGHSVYSLNEAGKSIMSRPHKQKMLALVGRILEHAVFHKVLAARLKKAAPLSTEETVRFMKESSLYNVKENSTFIRRAQTIAKWVEWILALPRA